MGCEIKGCTHKSAFGTTKCGICSKKACRKHYYVFGYTMRKALDKSYCENENMAVCIDCGEAILELIRKHQ